MIVTLTGENTFGRQRELQQIVQTFVAEHGDLALERLDGEEADFARLHEALTGLPLLARQKLVVLRAASTNKQFNEKFEQLVTEIPETTDVILIEPKLDKRTAYYKLVKTKTDFRDFPELDQHGLVRWLVDAAKARDASLSPAAARYLVERVGTSQQLLASELDKLALYNAEISRRSIDLLTEPTPQSTIFQLLEAAFGGNSGDVLKLYAEQRALKVEPPQIIAMLAWQLHMLAIVKTAGDRSGDTIAQEAKLNPFVVRKSQAIARQLSFARLKTLIADLLDIDRKTKRTAIDADEALQYFLLSLAA
jgi:DNA polymerase-3 subunit delta